MGSLFTFRTVDVSSGTIIDLISYPKANVNVVRFSPDDQWLAFNVESPDRSERTFISHLRNCVAASESERIQITDEGASGRVWWSPDGNLLYFISSRDGFRGYLGSTARSANQEANRHGLGNWTL